VIPSRVRDQCHKTSEGVLSEKVREYESFYVDVLVDWRAEAESRISRRVLLTEASRVAMRTGHHQW
jgi:hypothetical protein